MTAADAEACAVVATAADIICSLRGADLAGWTPPWRKHPAPPPPPACDADADADADARELAWPAVARGKRSRRGSPSGSASAAAKGRCGARGSPASPLDYSGGSGSSTSGGEDGAFCSTAPATIYRQAAPATIYRQAAPATIYRQAAPATAAPSKVGLAGRRTILPVPPPRPAGQRPRKKMRLPEIQQMVRSLSVENDALREEMKALQRACTALSKENGKLETKLDHSSKRNGMTSEENEGKPQPDQRAAQPDAQNGFVLPDLNLPADG